MHRLIAYTVPEFSASTPGIILREAMLRRVRKGCAVQKLETAFREYVGTKYAVAFPSARSALCHSYEALGVQGKKALMPSYTCIPAIDAARWAGAKLDFADIELDSYNPKIPGQLKGYGAVSFSYLYGLIGELGPALDAAKKADVPIVEDSAIALGGSFDGKKAGSIGDVGIFSLQESKIITSWRGGMVTTSRKDIFEKLSAMRQCMQTPEPKLLFNLCFSCTRRAFSRPSTYGPTMYALKRFMVSGPMVGVLSKAMDFNPLESINAESPGQMPMLENGMLSNLQAAIALQSMGRIDSIVRQRRKMALALEQKLESVKGISIPSEEGRSRHAYGRFPVRIKGVEKSGPILRMLKMGIECSPNYPYVCPCTPHFHGFDGRDFPNASLAAKETFLLPFHTLLGDGELDRMACAVKRIAEGAA